ncbi:MAG: hypothetical protein WAW13_02220 [Minisyncoccia bacterium]
MRLIKIYLGIVVTLLIVGLGCGVYVWYTIQSIAKEAESAAIQTGEERVVKKAPESVEENENAQTPVLETESTLEVQ